MAQRYEILAPAGSFTALQAAVQNGAHAVYLSGKDFGARKFANNFSDEELIEAIKYCHIRGVEVYVTVNTLVLNHEFARLKSYLDFLYTSGVDAVIVQDIGVLDYIRKTYPDLDIHCSTQMSVQTVADIKYLESLGAKRVVLGREMTVEDIKRAKQETNVQLEVFVHGALCISVSGQCLMSSLIGGRSGNRGSCAQPCRQKYQLYNIDKREMHRATEGSYLLSPRDLYTLEQIKEVVAAGAFSLKIEGRMKRPEYVAAVVNAYRLILEAAEQKKNIDLKALEKELTLFNRKFTKGHLYGVSGSDLMSMDAPGIQGYYLGKVVEYDKKLKKVTISLDTGLNHNDEIQIRRKDESIGGRVEKLEHKGRVVKSCAAGQVCRVNFKHACKPGEKIYKTYDEEYMKLVKQTFAKERLQISVSIKATILKGQKIICSISDGANLVEVVSEVTPQMAIKRAITAEEVKSQLAKLGGTPYKVEQITVTLDQGLSVAMKEINAIRRELIERLNQKRSAKYNRLPQVGKLSLEKKVRVTKKAQPLQFTASVRNLSQLRAVLTAGAEIVYYKDLESIAFAVETANELQFKGELIPEIYKLVSDAELKRYKELITGLGLETVLVQSYGHLSVFADLKIVCDYNLNVVNEYSYQFYLNKQISRISLSPELTLPQISALDLEPGKTEVFGYGYLPVMAMKHCVISTTLNKQKNCGLCNNNSYSIVDRLNESFKIIRRYNCTTELHNAKRHFLLENLQDLASAGVGYFRLNFVDESPQKVEMIVALHKKYQAGELTTVEREQIDKIKASGVTTGHLNRGVE